MATEQPRSTQPTPRRCPHVNATRTVPATRLGYITAYTSERVDCHDCGQVVHQITRTDGRSWPR